MYSNRLSKTYYNVLFGSFTRDHHARHISAKICGGWKSLVKPVTWQNISSCSDLSPEIVIHDDAYICGRSENNIKYIVHDDLGWKNWTTRYILPCHWLYKWFSQFHRCGTYSVLSRSPSIVLCYLSFSIYWTLIHPAASTVERNFIIIVIIIINM